MDRISKYRTIIVNAITGSNYYRYPSPNPNVETLFYQDEKQDRYLLYVTGWNDQKAISNVLLAVRVKEGKIWIDEDATEEGIATALLEAGVPAEDIVLAFHHPSLRTAISIAVA